MAGVLVGSNHAFSFRCARCGACCRTPWEVRLDAVDAGRLACAVAGTPFEATIGRLVAPASDSGFLLSRPGPGPDGGHPACALLGADDTCRLHADLGIDALPIACRNYPVDVVAAPWGREAYLELSCPAVASRLDVEPFRIVSDPVWDRPHDVRPVRAALAPLPVRRGEEPEDWSAWLRARRELLSVCGERADDPWAAAEGLVEAIRGRPFGRDEIARRIAAADPCPLGGAEALREAWCASSSLLAALGVRGDPALPASADGAAGAPVARPRLFTAVVAHKVFSLGLAAGMGLDRAVAVALWTLAWSLSFARAATSVAPPDTAAVAGVVAAEMLLHASLRFIDLDALEVLG